MSEKKLTPWFDGDVKPIRVGVYERDETQTDCEDGTPAYSYWTGEEWRSLCTNIRAAKNSMYSSGWQDLPWRGLARRPR